MSLRCRPGRLLPSLLVVCLVLGWAAPAISAPPDTADVIVVLRDGVDARSTAQDMARSHDARVGHVYEHALTGFAAEVPQGRLEGLRRDPRVAYVDENRMVHASEYPNGVLRVDGDVAHTNTSVGNKTGAGVRVAVIDTGIDLDHPDLDGNIDTGLGHDCITAGGSANDDQGHGTHVAGTIAAEANGSQVVGAAPGARLVPVKVLNSSGSGTWAQVICGIDWITRLNTDKNSDGTLNKTNDVHVANMSLGGSGSHDGTTCAQHALSPSLPSTSMFDALCKAMAAGATFTVAAGNDGKDAAGFVPAAYPDVITVSAYSDTNGQYDSSTTCSGRGLWKTCDEALASFSNYGSIVDVTAPGVNIVSTTYDGKTGTKSGTSMAAPHVAGVAALVIANSSTTLTPADVAVRLKDTGQCPDGAINPGADTCVGQTWNSDPDGIAEPMVNANWAAVGNGGSVTPVNSPPVANDDTASTPANTAVTISVLGNDSDPDGDGLTVTSVGTPTNGTATTNGTTVTYTPKTDYSGTDTFTYTISDGKGGTDSANITVTVGAVATTTMHVGDLASSAVSNGSTWTANVTILIVDADGKPVPTATVSATWSNGASGTATCATGTSGTCTVSKASIRKNTSSVTLTVTDVSHGTLTYEASENTDAGGDSNGTSIVVFKP